MDNELSSLYNRIKESRVSPEDAVQLIKEYKSKYNTASEVYSYNEPYLRDHTIFNEQVLIGVTHGSLAINTFFRMFPTENSVHLQRLSFVKPVEVKKGQQVHIQVEPFRKGSEVDFRVMYRYGSSEKWHQTAAGTLRKTDFTVREADVDNIESSLAELQDYNIIYSANPAVGLGESFRTITHLYTGQNMVLARVALNQAVREDGHEYILHPLIINSAFLAVNPLIDELTGGEVFLPFGIKDIYFRKTGPMENCLLVVKPVSNSGELVVFDTDVINDESRIVARFLGCSLKRLRQSGREGIRVPDNSEPVNRKTDQNITGISGKIRNYLIDKLTKIVRDPSRLSNAHVNLMDLGLESAQLVTLTGEIEKETNLKLYPTLFFEYPNIRELTEYFTREHAVVFNELSGDNPGENSIYKPDLPIKDWKTEVTATETGTTADIAVIGMHGIFAEASDLNRFWDNLCRKKDLIKEIPPDHWDYRPWYDPDPETRDRTYCKWGSFIDGVDKFDAGFFNISRREAEWMDPQLRFLLQSIYACGEDAGYISRLRGTDTGVFVGVCFHDYADKIAEMNLPVDPYEGTGNTQTVIANRVSFMFDFTGPSVAVDTACSSSLFALHYACQALRSKECGLAFVGGVNLLLSSWHYRYFSSIGALSPTGRCHTFDEAADGYVPGECIASILLKPLDQANRDGDRIYAVIKGSAAIHGGYTPSLTAPSVAGESKVILKAWSNAGIDPETLTYIEAHGTGTKLGDPIEINSVQKAFQQFTRKEGFCSIGSVKANIGHAEGAAGIAGVLKVILQMKHGKIPAMPGFNKLNPYINLDKSPLYINRETEEWKCPPGVPRRAGVSSFGFSGAYAHVVIEEYIPERNNRQQSRKFNNSGNPAIIVLSAKTEDRLQEQARCLLAALQETGLSDTDLFDIAYTLQTGREAMEERLAVKVHSIRELEEKLQDFTGEREGIGNLYRGHVKGKNVLPAVFEVDEELQEAIDKWIQRGKYGKLLDLWVNGLDIEWSRLYGEIKPRLISLPTYSFAGERYWIPETEARVSQSPAATAKVHSLLHENTSDLYKQCFTSIFTGREFFLADHVIGGRRILPGVVYLEMARAAVEKAAGLSNPVRPDSEKEWVGRCLKNMVWTRPVVVENEPNKVHIRLFPEENGEISFEVYSEPPLAEEGPVFHFQGIAVSEPDGEVPVLDLESLRARAARHPVSAARCYEALKSAGFELGPGLRGIEEVHPGTDYVLAKLSLPSAVSHTGEHFVLHPGLMDAALQSAGLMLSSTGMLSSGDIGPLRPAMPFSLQELIVMGHCTPEMWALVRYGSQGGIGDTVRKFDIDLTDSSGQVRVSMKGLSFRVLEDETGSVGALLLYPSWREQAVTPEVPVSTGETAIAEKRDRTPEYERHIVMLLELEHLNPEDIAVLADGVQYLSIKPEDQDIGQRFQAYVEKLFEELQEIISNRPEGRVLIQVIIPNRGEGHLFSGLTGLIKTARLENSKIIGQLIEVEPDIRQEDIIRIILENSRNPADSHISYQGGKRGIPGWDQLETAPNMVDTPWKDRGVYLITGGAGGLGLIFAGEIAQKAGGAALILTGRSSLDEKRTGRIKELEKLGARVLYKQADVTRKEDVAALIRDIREEYGNLNGIIHCAGLVHDSLIVNKTTDEAREVMAPKVTGLVNLDEAIGDMDIDIFILFSSIAGVMGNPGQADYAAANAFMDAYAGYRNSLVTTGQQHGQTVSVNWPLWQKGGMNMERENAEIMLQNTGMTAMETSTGIEVFYRVLASGADRAMVMAGNLKQMKTRLWGAPDVASGSGSGSLSEKVRTALARTLAQILKIDAKDIDTGAELGKYGFDSITSTKFTAKLNKEYGLGLNPTVFFEYPTIRRVTEYMVSEFREILAARFEAEVPVKASSRSGGAGGDVKNGPGRRARFAWTGAAAAATEAQPADTSSPEPVAVIGMSGIFPMAADVNKFWKNLAAGRDCITEIPPNRWDWRDYYGDPAREINKSNIKWGGFIEGVDEFDPLFFGISPREAELMDPQQRLMMIYIWKAIEDAGYAAQSLWGTRTGIFVGTGDTGYRGLVYQSAAIEGFSATGTVPSVGPNRMSYYLNIHGPSEPVETACSSSLVAIHRAVESIRNGHCEMALAGGVNTIVTPELHISFSKAGMLCEDGRCKTFSDKANGYVRGEGAGMLFLKKLSAAEEAGDHIYGVIRGTAENHGGRANSLTAPNPKAQAELLINAYTGAGIDPRTLGYIETHGTGTELGDPMEINGLKEAFRDLYRNTGDSEVRCPHCGLGSVKTNIGHLELAAGIAGVIKVLLQLKHMTLAKSLHCDTINPYISLEDSPFYIVRETQEWKSLKDERGRELPRRAGVSSFGFGGANAHVVIEEYIPGERRQSLDAGIQPGPAIIVLSARNEDRLREQVQQLLAAIDEQQFRESSLADMAYTLQAGRDPMEERLAVIVRSIAELREKLERLLAGRDDIEGLYRGGNRETAAAFTTDDELEEAVDKWFSDGEYEKIAELWVKGMSFDWEKLYWPVKPSRISLPTYPFARERCWITRIEKKSAEPAISHLHPLVHQNTSGFFGQQFSSTFTGQEFFLTDHIVKGMKVLPGVAYLEMARAAAEMAAGTREGGNAGMEIRDVVWVRPIAVRDESITVHIRLFPGDNGEISFQVSSESDSGVTDPVVHSQGILSMGPCPEGPALDLTALKALCSRGGFSSEQWYEAILDKGAAYYGPGLRGVSRVYLGQDCVLAQLALPEVIAASKDRFVLHPTLLDSAFQVSLGLTMGAGYTMSFSEVEAHKPALPFALREVRVFTDTVPEWAFIRYGNDSRVGEQGPEIDIDLCDHNGRVCIQMKGFSTRVLEGEVKTRDIVSCEEMTLTKGVPLTGNVILAPVWDVTVPEKGPAFPGPTDRVFVIGGTAGDLDIIRRYCPRAHRLDIEPEENIDSISRKLEACIPIEHIIWIAPRNDMESISWDNIVPEQDRGVLQVFRIIKSLLGLGYGAEDLGWSLLTTQTQPIHRNDRINPTHAGLYGLIGSMAKEYPNWKVRLIDLEAGCDWPAAEIFSLPPDPGGNAWVYRNYQWHRQLLLPLNCYPPEKNPYRTGGVYVVIGGAGGIGEAWSEYMVRTYQARVVWIGRRMEDESIRAKLDRIAGLGPKPLYIAADAGEPQELNRAYEIIKNRYGVIHGVIHSAIVLLDQSLANMDEERFRAGISAKLDVSVSIAKVFQKEPLDFVMFFSSIITYVKPPGQSNYASGCTFKDVFAHLLAQEWPCAVKVINWGYWGSVGVVACKEYRERMAREGFGSIEPPEAMDILEMLLRGPVDRIALIKTTKPLDMEGIYTGETVTVYPQNLLSNVRNISEQFITEGGLFDVEEDGQVSL